MWPEAKDVWTAPQGETIIDMEAFSEDGLRYLAVQTDKNTYILDADLFLDD